MAKPNLTKEKIIERLEVIKNSSKVIGADGIANDIEELVKEITKDL